MQSEIVIALYHHVSDADDPLSDFLNVRTKPEIFNAHVKYFSRNYDIISGTDLLDAPPRKALLITFDDAYRSIVDIAEPILKTFNAPSLFFINASTVTGERVPIDNILSYCTSVCGIEKVMFILDVPKSNDVSVSSLITNVVSKMKQSEVMEAKKRLCAAAGTTESALSRVTGVFLKPDDLSAMAKNRMEIGNHTQSHTFLRSLGPSELVSEIAGNRATLMRLSGQTVRHFSVPYGGKADAGESVLNVVRNSEHKGIFLVHAKSNRFRNPSDVYYRISLGNTPVEKLFWRLQVMPIVRSLRDAGG